MIIFLWQPADLVSGAGSHFLKAPWYIGISDCGWKPDNLNLLSEPNLEKYRLQRRLIGPVYTPDSIKDLEILKNPWMRYSPRMWTWWKLGLVKALIWIYSSTSFWPVSIFSSEYRNTSDHIVDCMAITAFSESNGLVESDKDDGSIRYTHASWKYVSFRLLLSEHLNIYLRVSSEDSSIIKHTDCYLRYMHVIGYFPLIHRTLAATRYYAQLLGALHQSVLQRIARSHTSKQKSGHPFAVCYPISRCIEDTHSYDSVPHFPDHKSISSP